MAVFKLDTLEALRFVADHGPVGNRWFKANLHVHCENSDPADLVREACEAGIDLIAITDHQSFANCSVVSDLASDSLVVLPGIEVTSVEGVHLLSIFPAGFTPSRQEQFLGWLEIRHEGDTRHASTRTVVDILEKVREEGGLTVTPHPFSDDIGLLDAARKMGTREQWLETGHIQLMQFSDDQREKVRYVSHDSEGNWVNRFVLASASEEQIANSSYCLAPINRSDVYDPAEISIGCTWLRMSEPSIRGLKQVTCEPHTRISLTQPDDRTHDCILGVQVEGGYCDGEIFWFNDGLNCLVGQNYAGKSAVFDFLRFALEDFDTFEGRARSRLLRRLNAILQPGGRVEVYLRKDDSFFVVRRSFSPIYSNSTPPETIGCSTKAQAYKFIPEHNELLATNDLVFEIEVYEQGRISRLREDLERQLEMLDEFAGLLPLRHERSLTIESLNSSAVNLAPLYDELEACKSTYSELPTLRDEIGELTRYLPTEDDDQWSRSQAIVQRLTSIAAEMKGVADELAVEPVTKETERKSQIEKLYAQRAPIMEEEEYALPTVLGPWIAAVEHAIEVLEESRRAASEAISNLLDESRTLQEAWAAGLADYETVLRTRLAEAGVDSPLELISNVQTLRNRITHIEEVIAPRLNELTQSIASLEEGRSELLSRLRSLTFELSDRRRRKAQELTSKLDEQIKITLEDVGDTSEYVTVLNELCDEITTSSRKIQNRDAQINLLVGALDPLTLAEGLKSNGVYRDKDGNEQSLSAACSVTQNTVEVLSIIGDNILLLNRLQCVLVADLPKISVRRHGEDSYGDLSTELSPGEQSSAILTLALLTREMPLVLDQPEDEIGYNLVVHLIVPKILSAKFKRQLLIVTHNANVPMLGDADYLIKMLNQPTASGSRSCFVGTEGGFESPDVTRALLELEGGEQAFAFRQHRYGLPRFS